MGLFFDIYFMFSLLIKSGICMFRKWLCRCWNSANEKIILTLCALSLIALTLASGDCPSSTKVQTCTPKCLHDTECSAIGGKCCPNLCNGRSCVQPNLLSNAGSRDTSPFNKNSGSSGSYCGNVKCSAFQKCENDRATKRPKCVRA